MKYFFIKIILEIGCGTCLFSIFAILAGAKHIYAVENSEFYEVSKQIIKDNNFEDKITLFKKHIEEIELPIAVDIIISDWMGNFLLSESLIDSIIFARDKFLKHDGIILPDRACLNLSAIQDEESKSMKIDYWNNVYGIDMSCIREVALKEVMIGDIEKNKIISSICKVVEIDLNSLKKEDLNCSSKYEITFLKLAKCHGFIFWFDISFSNLPNKINFNTSPFNKSTLWSQCVIYLDEEYLVNKGEVMKGSFALMRNFGDLDIKFSFHLDGKYSKCDSLQYYKLKP